MQRRSWGLFALWAVWSIGAGQPAAVGADVVTEWNEAARNAIRSSATPPPRASRALAMLHASMYDAVNAVDRTHAPYRYTLTAPDASAEAAAAQAARDVLANLFPANALTFDGLLASHLANIADSSARNSGVALGTAIAADMLAWRSSDGSDATSDYTLTNAPGRWRPTTPGTNPLLPQWGGVTPFGIADTAAYIPAPPPALGSAEYADAVNQVRDLGRLDSAVRTADQTEIARFWANGAGTETPPGHWNRIALTVGEQRGNTLQENARMLAMLNVALADAAIVSWECKYDYDLWRPLTAIHEADTDGNPLTAEDDAWQPLLTTPPFPEYTSGHSTFSGAGAAVLAAFFGSDSVAFTVGSDDIINVLRSYGSFSEAALESGLSRIYGGIHYSFANQAGLMSGGQVGHDIAASRFLAIPEATSAALAALAAAIGACTRRGRRAGATRAE